MQGAKQTHIKRKVRYAVVSSPGNRTGWEVRVKISLAQVFFGFVLSSHAKEARREVGFVMPEPRITRLIG
jgi:hypothetical protein